MIDFFTPTEPNQWLDVVAAVLVAMLGVGRLSRIITYDAWPPTMWWRQKWAELMDDGPWTKLFTCPWCFTPWLMLVCIGWFFLGFAVPWIAVAWWVFWGWLAITYIATIILARDEPE